MHNNVQGFFVLFCFVLVLITSNPEVWKGVQIILPVVI